MLKTAMIAGALALTMAAALPELSRRLHAQNVPTATCKGCPATYVSEAELQAYLKRAIAKNQIDQQVRSVDVGKSGVAIGMVHRTRLDKPANNSVAEHDHVSEVYHVISGSATLMTGPDLVDAQRRPATNENVRLLNGPGSNAASIRNGVSHQLKAGDAIIIPAGTGHWFTKIDDHITYIMIRIDPDKVVPLKDEAASKAYLATP
jgi:mannose-6-phosphate isomerase-like protein (cupin superfamily)